MSVGYAYLINVARGDIIDEEAIIEALEKGQIAGATLDVFAQEPLPQDSRLWTLGNVFITPHISGNTAGYVSLVTIIFADNLTRYIYGERLLNEAAGPVEKARVMCSTSPSRQGSSQMKSRVAQHGAPAAHAAER